MCTGCTSLFYLPRIAKTKFYYPAKVELIQQEIEITPANGVRIHAWWFDSKTNPAKGTVVFFHGNAENLTTHFLALSWLPAEGYNYIIWDYPGYGVSEGEPSPENNAIAAIEVLNWIHVHKDSNPLIIYGHSLGGNVALKAALEVKDKIPLKAVIIDASFISFRSMAKQKASESWFLWPFQPIAWLIMSDQFAPEKINELAPVPLLIIHGQKDNVIHPKFGEQIFEKAAEPKQIWRIPDGRHGDTFWSHDRSYRKKLIDYLAALPCTSYCE